VPNPLAIGVTLGGLLLDVIAPRPKPRVGVPRDVSPATRSADVRTPAPVHELHDGPPVASGSHAVATPAALPCGPDGNVRGPLSRLQGLAG
jgi:hypothetical protein